MGDYFITSIGPKSGSMAGRKNELSEDLEISLRITKATGKKIVYNPAVKVQHRIYNERLKTNYIVRWSYWVGLSKQKLRKMYYKSNNNILSQEHQLLKRIFLKLCPSIFKTSITHPVIAWRRFKLTAMVLFFVAFGYFSSLFKLPWANDVKQRKRKLEGV